MGCHFLLQGTPPSAGISSQPRDQTRVSCVSCIAGRFFTTEPSRKPLINSIHAPLTHSVQRKGSKRVMSSVKAQETSQPGLGQHGPHPRQFGHLLIDFLSVPLFLLLIVQVSSALELASLPHSPRPFFLSIPHSNNFIPQTTTQQ